MNQIRPEVPVPSTPLVPAFAFPAPTTLSPHPDRLNLSSTIPLTSAQSDPSTSLTTDSPSTTKRSAFEDLRDRVDKRIKAFHDSPSSNHTTTTIPHLVDNFSISPPFLPGPTSRTASDYMNENPTSAVVHTSTAPVQSSLERVTIVQPDISIPGIPLEAIKTLQQASSDMLRALVKKDATDREKQLMGAVGTIRTCLEIEFAPHMEIWKESARSKTLVNLDIIPQKTRWKSSRPSPGTPTGPRDDTETSRMIDPSRVAVRRQLAEAQVNLRNLEKRIRDQELELARSKDENKMKSIQLAKLIEGNRNLSTLLAKSKLETKTVSMRFLAKTTALFRAEAERDKIVTTSNETIQGQKRKIAAQKNNIRALENQNARLKDKTVVTPPQPQMGKKEQGDAEVVSSGGQERQTGLVRRGNSMERDGKGDEATTPTPRRDLDDARSSASVGPTLLRSHESPTPMNPTQFTCLAMVSSSCLVSPTGTDRVDRGPSAIGHQSRERKRPRGEKAAEHQAEEMGEMSQSGVVEKDHEVELEEGELVDEWQERSGGGTWVSDWRRVADWVDHEPRGS